MFSTLKLNHNPSPNMKKLIDENGDSLLRMCFLYLKDLHLAEDAVQDTLLKVFNNYHQFKGDSTEKTWMMRIAINVCKNYQRKTWWKYIEATVALESIPTDGDVIEDDSLILEIMKLSPKYKEVILLFYYQDMKIREIADTLQIPESIVASRLKRGREKLRNNLEGWLDYE